MAFSIGPTMFFPRCHQQRACVADADRSHLAQRHLAAVVADRNVIQQAGMRAAGSQFGQFLLEAIHALGHPVSGFFL